MQTPVIARKDQPVGLSQNRTVPIRRGGWLDVLRFAAALLMIVHHYQAAGPFPLASLHPVFERGFLLTDFFLIDSGYVLGRVYASRVLSGQVSYGAFFWRRAARVVPAHLIMVSSLVALVGGAALFGLPPRHPEWFDWSQLPAQFFLVQAFGVPGGLGWNAPSWSMSALLGCYLAFPWLVRGMNRLGPWQALAVGAAVFGVADLLTLKLLGYPVYQMPMKYGVERALPLFFAGLTLAWATPRITLPASLAKALGVTGVLALAAVQAHGAHGIVSLALIALLIVCAASIPVQRASSVVEKAAVVSFSMFITNEVVRIAWFGVVNQLALKLHLSQPVHWALWGAGVLAAVGFAIVFHYAIDQPTQRWIQPLFDRRTPRPAVGANAGAVAA